MELRKQFLRQMCRVRLEKIWFTSSLGFVLRKKTWRTENIFRYALTQKRI